MKRIILKPGEENRILAGHPWVYDNEIAAVVNDNPHAAAKLVPGECADVESSPGKNGKPRYLGRAIVNPQSRIAARIYSPSKEGLDKGFFKRRIREALERRITAGYDLSRESARIVFAEADGLPGLIIDRFVSAAAGADMPPESWLVIQFLSFGMDSRKEMILEALDELADNLFSAPAGIIEKSAPVRELEGLSLWDGILRGGFPSGGAVIAENGLSFLADLVGGQKTGHFLDQRDNHALAGRWARALFRPAEQAAAAGAAATGAKKVFRILDCFCYTGGFSIHTGRALENVFGQNSGPAAENILAGNTTAVITAAVVTAVDSSAAALELVRKNAGLNGLAVEEIEAAGPGLDSGVTIHTREANAFDFLREAERHREKYDMIILDPPAFAKSRSSLEGAERGYKEINLRALKLLNKGGILITCSCSHAMDESRFKRIIAEAAADADRRIIQLDFRYQAPDHPVLVGYDESFYLKCGFYRVL